MLHDLRYALRLIQKTPIASLIAVLTVAIGVGANTAICSIIRAVLLKPLPYAHAERLVQINESWPTRPGPRPVSSLNYADWIAQSDGFERLPAGINLHFYDTPLWRPLPRNWGPCAPPVIC